MNTQTQADKISARSFKFLFVATLIALVPNFASAHVLPDGGHHHGLSEGFSHPFLGLDHLLAMIAVGLWAAQQKGRTLWLIPLTFVSVMVLGGFLGLANSNIPFVELFIAGSLLVLGALIFTSAKFIPIFSMALVGFFALFHGYAHGHEMTPSASAFPFGIGFMAATLLLHGIGMLAGQHLQRIQRPLVIRLAGAAISLCSIYFFVH